MLELDLREATMMVQDWGGPIGFGVGTRHPKRFAAFVVGNTWAWPKSDPGTQAFSRFLGGPIGQRLLRERNLFVERILPGAVLRRTLSPEAMDACGVPARSWPRGRSWPRWRQAWARCATAPR